MGIKIRNGAAFVISLIGGIFVLLCFVLSVFFYSRKAFASDWFSHRYAVIAVMCIFLFAGIMVGFRIIERLSVKGRAILSAVLFALFAAGGVVMAINFNTIQKTDAYVCLDTAMGFAKGTISKMTPEESTYYNYFSWYSNNNFFVMFFAVIFKLLSLFGVSDFLYAAVWVNAVAVFLGVFLTYKSAGKLYGEKMAAKVLLICVLNPLLYLFIPWVYTLTMSLPFIMGCVYLGACIRKSKNLKVRVACSAGAGVLAAAGYLMRPTSVFPIIAYAVTAVLASGLKKESLKKLAAVAGAFAAAFLIMFPAFQNTVNRPFKEALKYNFPVTHWVMMGLNKDGRLSREDNKFTSSFKSADAKKRANINEIKRRLSNYTPVGMAVHLIKKTSVTWADGNSGYTWRIDHNRYYTKLYDYIVGENSFLLECYAQSYRIIQYLLVLVAVVKLAASKRRLKMQAFPLAVTLLGGIVFYLIWEAKGPYSFPFLPIMSILAAAGTNGILKAVKPVFAQKRKVCAVSICGVLSAVTVIAALFSALFFNEYTQTKVKKEAVVLNNTECSYYSNIKDLGTKQQVLTQEFTATKSFNTIMLAAKKTDLKNVNLKYDVKLTNSQGKIAARHKVSARNINQGFITIKSQNDKKLKAGTYKISITPERIYYDTIAFIVNRSEGGIDNYQGSSTLGGAVKPWDLNIKVLNRHEAFLYTPKSYLGLSILFILPQVLIIAMWAWILLSPKSLIKKEADQTE